MNPMFAFVQPCVLCSSLRAVRMRVSANRTLFVRRTQSVQGKGLQTGEQDKLTFIGVFDQL